MNPIIVEVFGPENTVFKGILTSKNIGVKVFLHSISLKFGFAPTKAILYKAWKDPSNPTMLRYEEIQTKGNCTKRLSDFGINGDGNCKLFLAHSDVDKINGKADHILLMKNVMNCKQHETDFSHLETMEKMDHFFDDFTNNKKASKNVQRQRRLGISGLNIQTSGMISQQQQ